MSETIIDCLREQEELADGELSVEEEIEIIIHNIASIQKRIEELEEEANDRLKEELKERLSKLSEMYEGELSDEGDVVIGARIEEVSKLLTLIEEVDED